MSSSETESESESEHTLATKFVPDSVSESPPHSILDTIARINGLVLPRPEILSQDMRLQNIISQASNELLTFLNCCQHIVQDIQPTETTRRRLVEFGALVDHRFLATLFQQRKVFHRIAAQGIHHSSGAVVCWVDAILAKMGDTIVSLASGLSLDSLNPTLVPGREEDGLRAAAQLPVEWGSVSSVIASEEASSATKRLALRLIFAAVVLGPDLNRRNKNSVPPKLSETLERYLLHSEPSGFSTSIAGDRLAVQERLNLAMIICLFSTVHHQSRSAGRRIQMRPHTLSRLLRVVQEVIHPKETISMLQLVHPLESIDGPINLILSWADVVAWCWEVWDDHRMVGSETILYLTSMWLRFTEGPETIQTTPASSVAILRVLHHIVLSLTTASVSPPPSPTIITHACSCGIKSIEYLLNNSLEGQDWIVLDFGKVFLSLFVLLEPRPAQVIVGDLVLEALSLLDPETLELCLVQIQQDITLRFSARLNERLILVPNFVSANPQVTWDVDSLGLVRATLNFLTIIWQSKSVNSVPKQPASALLLAVIEFLSINSASRVAYEILGDTVFIASAAAKQDQQRETLWGIAMSRSSSEVYIAAAFSHYIDQASSLCGPLYCAEAWRYLTETLLLIVKRHYTDDQEPLALLVCPTICKGLLRLLSTESAGREYMLSTPLTMNICAELKHVLTTAGSDDEYTSFLKDRLSMVGPCLLEAIRTRSSCSVSELAERVIFYRLESGAGRVAVVV